MTRSVVGVCNDVVDRLTSLPLDVRHGFLSLPATRQAHAGAHAQVDALHQIELLQPVATTKRALRVAAWNLERCLYADESARVLARHGVDIALLTEMDVGILRTGQVHTISRVASLLGQGYCYGLEFLELVSPQPPAGFPRNGTENAEAFHGNGIVSSLQMAAPIVIRLDEQADWFAPRTDNQRRVGNRMAVAARFEAAGAGFVACAVHLENRTDGAGRAAQMRTLLDALDTYAGGLPVVIGGDLNTHVGPGGYTEASEPLFAMAVARGYDWSACNLAQPTTRASIWSESEGTRQLDWFCTRGVSVADPAIVPALGDDATVLSDHELLLLTLQFG